MSYRFLSSQRLSVLLALALIPSLYFSVQSSVYAADDFKILDGMGEELVINRGAFGSKETLLKDRYSNSYQEKKTAFGSQKQEASLLGNKISRKKSWFGKRETKVDTIFGDKYVSKKGIFGGKSSELDVSGIASLISGLKSQKQQSKGLPEFSNSSTTGSGDTAGVP